MVQKKKDQDVLIVKDEKTGEIGVVAGLNKDGTPKMTGATPDNQADFLKFDRHGDVLDNFFTNFFRQCKDPHRFGFYRVAADGVENVLDVLKTMLKDPIAHKELLAAHKVDTSKYEAQAQVKQETPTSEEPKQTEKHSDQTEATQGYKPIDKEKLNFDELEKRWGVKMDELEKSGDLEKMLNYGKSRLVSCYPEIAGVRFPMQARLSLRTNEDGTVSLVPHPIRKEINMEEYKNIKFSPEDQDNLKKSGNLGRVVDVVDKNTGELVPSYISIDRQTNQLVSTPVKNIRIPDEVLGVKLDDKQKQALAEGKGVYVENMVSNRTGKKFNATIQINADRQGLDFHFGGQRKNQQQKQDGELVQKQDGEKQPRQLRIRDKLLGKEITPEMRSGLEQGKWVYMEGLTDKQGKQFNAYVRANPEKGKYDFSRKNPEQSQVQEVKPDNAARTQVAVNSEGKTNEATKRIKEPLNNGQTAPKNDKQQKKQSRPKMKM